MSCVMMKHCLAKQPCLKIGVDVVELLRSKCTVPAATARRTEAAAAGSSGSEPDSDSECDEMMWVNRVMMREEEKQMPPDVDRHEPEKVQTALDTALDKAQLAGLSKQAVDKLREHVSTTSADAFRLVLSNDPPARVAPIKVHVDADVFATKQGRRRYSKADSVFMAAMMRKLEDFGYVYADPAATCVSPAYPVTKADPDPNAPPETQKRLTVDLRWVNSHTRPIRYPLPVLQTFAETVAGMGYFGTLDLFNGYWQLPLDKKSQQYFSIVTDRGIWTPT